MIQDNVRNFLFERGFPNDVAAAVARRCERKIKNGAIPGVSNLTALRYAEMKPGPLIRAIAFGGNFGGDALTGDPRPEELREAVELLARDELKGMF
jgi:hypothetical protein